MPSLRLSDLTYREISNTSALLGSTSTFVDQAALPGAPVELEAISSKWSSKVLRGNAFSLEQLRGGNGSKIPTVSFTWQPMVNLTWASYPSLMSTSMMSGSV